MLEVVEGDAAGASPSKYRIRLINAGTSHNGNHYPLDVLHRAASKFKGVRALARDDDQHVAGRGKNVSSLVGWIEDVIPVPEGLDGIFVAEAEWLRTKMGNAWRMGKKDYIGFSAVAETMAVLRQLGGRAVHEIRDITNVKFVDTVVNPSAGGELLGVAEAEGTGKGRTDPMNIDRLLKIIERRRPVEYGKLDKTNIDEAKVLEIVEAISAQDEADAAQREKDAQAEADTAAAKARTTAEAAARGAPADVTAAVTAAVDAAVNGVMERLARENSVRMVERMVAESDLPRGSDRRVMATLPQGKSWTADEVANAITAEREYLGKNRFRGPGNVIVAEGVVDELDKYHAALLGFFTGVDEPVGRDGKNTQERFHSIREAYVELTGDARVTGRVDHAPKVHDAAEAAITSGTWAGALGNAMHIALQREYRMAPTDQWRAIADSVNVNDFRRNDRPQLGGFSSLDIVNEGADYTEAGTEPDDFTPYYQVTKKGNTQVVTLETIVNDNVGAVQRLPRKLARAAARTLNAAVWAPIINNSNVSWEAVALCAAGHGSNITTSAMSPTTIAAGRLVMLKQTEPQSGERLMLEPRWLAVSPDQEKEAWEYCTAAGKPILGATDTNAAAGTATTGTIENDKIGNFIAAKGLMPLVIPHHTSATKCWLIADRADVPLVEVGFLGGRQEPELFVQDMPNVGSMFTADKLTYKERFIFGVAVLDYRGFYYFNA
jgi:hypothetical protein